MKKIITLSACVLLLMIVAIPSKTVAQTLTTEDIKAQMVKDWNVQKHIPSVI